MRLVPLVTIEAMIALPACGAAPGSDAAQAPFGAPAAWVDDSGLGASGFGRVTFTARGGNHVTALVYRGSGFDPASGPIWFVMHGASRDADRYLRAAAPVAERQGALLIVPHFTKDAYPRESDYSGPWRDRRDTTYAEIEHLFDAVRGSLRGRQQGYYLFGHSAGAQFTHRLLTFLPGARALGAVAANAGWYTLPTDEAMPYGLRGSTVGPRQLRALFAIPLVVLLGERDTTTAATDELVRGTPEAQAQGSTRIERGRFYFRTAEAKSKEMGAGFAWRLAIVPRAPHDAARMLPSAGFLLFSPGVPACEASEAAEANDLKIARILVDPPKGDAGDANRDGKRDPSDDELVELANTGKTPLCLSGWALGDVEDPERFVFPLGRALLPGRSIIVFGGGVPKGSFGDAEVATAPRGLDLTNVGDVITLRDRKDSVVRQVSWGDCAGVPCATDHRAMR
jgi:hypothetical protein